MNEKIAVAMSGGVDSSITALLLKKTGWDPVGVSFKMPVWLNKNKRIINSGWKVAQKVCKDLKISHHIIDLTEEFEKTVVFYFKSELLKGRTPNPCIICNPNIKFKTLIGFADKNKIKYVATGHYAQLTDNFKLKIAKDISKDQTYTLSQLPHKWLKRIVLPLGKYTKKQIYKIARENGFEFFETISQSQDFCYLKKSSLEEYIKKEIGVNKGNIFDETGQFLGEHKGINFYTVGQRKGLLLGNGPYFVKETNFKKNQVIVTKNKNNLLNKIVKLSDLNFFGDLKSGAVQARIRYRHPLEEANIQVYNKTAIVEFKKKQAVTPGQFCVFYRKDICLGSGVIN